jgi:transcriptional regulator with XRE-family HTH domain
MSGRAPAGQSLAAEFGALLVEQRKRLRLSRRAVAADLGVHPNTLLEVERGDANPTLDRVGAIAAGYGLELHLTADQR